MIKTTCWLKILSSIVTYEHMFLTGYTQIKDLVVFLHTVTSILEIYAPVFNVSIKECIEFLLYFFFKQIKKVTCFAEESVKVCL